MSRQLFELRTDEQSMTFDPLMGGRVTSWEIHGVEVLTGTGTHPVEHGMYVMAPWAGRLRSNRIEVDQLRRWGISAQGDYVPDVNYPPWALHGTCLAEPIENWELVSENIVQMTQPIPGWSGTLTTEWRIEGLTAYSSLTVEASSPMPALMGWHPWFRMVINGQPALWTLSGELLVKEEALPTGERVHWAGETRVDDAFAVSDAVVNVAWGDLSLEVRNSHPWFVVFDELDEALCVEPQNGPPNAFELPMTAEPPIARPGHPQDMTTQWLWGVR